MGIPGLLNELGPGERISLSKLAVTHFERTSRPLRIAVDISIWLFRVQAGRGGTNPEVRTLFFRLLKLLALPIHPLFVFDGEHKPPFKRGKALNQGNGPNASVLSLRHSKRLIDLFSFPRHTAPGEAEAECARLQVTGVVDAVMSDDVDTLMFGSRTTIMNFSRENSSGTEAATHVNLYRTGESQSEQGNVSLNRAEMVLFAMLSGGDYLPSGVPKCGHKIAAQISRAGFGSDLLEAIKGQGNPETKLTEWRKRLQHELHENENGFFQRRNRAVKIPETFPDKTILSYYTDPVVSTHEEIEKLRESLKWDRDIDVVELHRFVDNAFGWTSTPGLKRFIKVFFPPMVSYKLRLKIPVYGQVKDVHPPEKIYRKRAIYVNDGITELQFEFIPADVVGLELDNEASDLPQEKDVQEFPIDQDLDSELDPEDQPSVSNKRQPKGYDPLRPEKVWIFESIAKTGAPEAVATWRHEQERKEAALNEAKARIAERAATRTGKKKSLESGMRQGELFRYAARTKLTTQLDKQPSSPEDALPSSLGRPRPVSPLCKQKSTRSTKRSTKPSPRKKKESGLLSSPKVDKTINPFTIARSQARSRNDTPSNNPELGNRALDIFSAASRAASKDRAVDDDPFLPGMSPPPLPGKPTTPRCSKTVTVGASTEPITISSSPIPSPSIPTAASLATLGEFSTNSRERQEHPEAHLPGPQTPPAYSDLPTEDIPFSSPTNILTPTPKPKTKAREPEPHLSPPQPIEPLDSEEAYVGGNNDSHDHDQTTDLFISSSTHTEITPTKPSQASTTIPKSPTRTRETEEDSKLSPKKNRSAYYVDSYNGYWTCRKDESTDTDPEFQSLNSDSTSSSYSDPKGNKSRHKKIGRVSILDLT